MKAILKYSFLGLVLLLTFAPGAHAGPRPVPAPPPPTKNSKAAPELDPALAMTGIALLAGSLSVARARHSRG